MNDKIMNAGFDHPCKQTCSGWMQGHQRGVLEGKERIWKALEYCMGHTDKMWAASIVSILTNTDFRDAKQTLEQMGIK